MAKQPRSPAELEKLSIIPVDPNISIRLYFRSADLLFKQAHIYKLEHDWEHAYVLYMKFTNLGISELPKHPAYKNAENKKSLKQLNRNCLEALEALEQMKPVLEEAYASHVKKIEQAEEAKKASSISNQTTQWLLQQRPVETVSKDWNLQDALKGVAGVRTEYSEVAKSPTTGTGYQKAEYPSLSLHNQSDGYVYQAQLPTSVQSPPQLPPKIRQQPTLPPKIPINRDIHSPELPPKIKLHEDKEIHRSGPTTDASTERGEPLRKLLLPKRLHARFVGIADRNTRNKIETCGILAGTLKNNILKITTLIIPKQTGTPDTCTTENEEDLFDIQDKHDLLTFGWIHTHPTQSCFLSSVDLHTHCSYQLMLPEAIAIVCAPSQTPNFGIFRLTDPPGLDIISNCKATPAFHPHPDLPIYTAAEGDGHVGIADYDFTVLDLRDNK
ncbi:hypothetical protein INT47_008235 [Mucor saturninus]|uniref:MPN domain-containing protein n=1 Tax=Mucor saturninus TaxID=64648 RepID=A0A8H7QIJ8_9FUNG|nr:hypothetical protein INT47_008235 [Mucor saturninus]